MGALSLLLLAAATGWTYPAACQRQHEHLRGAYLAAARAGDVAAMQAAAAKGVKLLPDDPTWRYNYACSLARGDEREDALDELERAIDLGFRKPDVIAADRDLAGVTNLPRFAELVGYARESADRPVLNSRLAKVPAEGTEGGRVVLAAHNVVWDLDAGLFQALLRLAPGAGGGNAGDLYFNRDEGHSLLKAEDFPGVTRVGLDAEGRQSGQGRDFPNMLFPYPVFGNASRAFTEGRGWRSIPRAMMTTEAWRMKSFCRLYLANQVWVFPAHRDLPPAGSFGDVFSSVAPYWLVTAGSSWSDQPYLRGALEASRSFAPGTKAELVRRGLLAPTVMTLVRKSLRGVTNETAYLSAKAHPTALPPGGLELDRLKAASAALATNAIPPVVPVAVLAMKPKADPPLAEVTYATPFATAWILRSADTNRVFFVRASGAGEYAYSVVRDDLGAVRLDRERPDVARLTIDRSRLTVSNRVDVAVFGRNAGTGWGAPSYVSFAVTDSKAPYSDPFLR